MKNKLWSIWDNMVETFRLWTEFWAIPFVLLKFIGFGIALQLLFPEAATFDIGILQTISLVIVAMVCYNGAVFFGIKLNFPFLYKHYKDLFFNRIELTPFHRTCALLIIYVSLLSACVLLTVAFA